METLAQVYSYEFCEISKNTLYTEHLRVTASVCVIKSLGKAINGDDGLGMKIPCRLLFFLRRKSILMSSNKSFVRYYKAV